MRCIRQYNIFIVLVYHKLICFSLTLLIRHSFLIKVLCSFRFILSQSLVDQFISLTILPLVAKLIPNLTPRCRPHHNPPLLSQRNKLPTLLLFVRSLLHKVPVCQPKMLLLLLPLVIKPDAAWTSMTISRVREICKSIPSCPFSCVFMAVSCPR